MTVNGTGVGWGLPNGADWAIDSVAPWMVLRALAADFSGGWWEKYPPLHLALLALLYLPFVGRLELAGRDADAPGPPAGVADVPVLSDLILVSRLVSVVMGTGIVLFVYLTGRELFDRTTGFFSGLVVALYYPLVHYAHTANLDVPYLFWSAAAVHAYVRALKRGAARDYVLFALWAAFAICTKDQAYGIFVLSPLPLLWARWSEARRHGGGLDAAGRVLLDRRHLLALLTAAAAFALVHNLAFNASGFVEHVRYITGEGSDPWREFAASAGGRLRLLGKVREYLEGNLGAPLFVAMLAGTVYGAVRHPRETLPLLVLAASYVLTFLMVVLYVMQRFALPVAVLLAIPTGKLLSDLWRGGRWRGAVRLAVVASFLPVAAKCVQLDVLFLRDARYAAERWLEARLRDGDVVETLAEPWRVAAYYPRFPARVEVRSTAFEPGGRPDGTTESARAARALAGASPPRYVVLSEFTHGRFVAGHVSDPGVEALSGLLRGPPRYVLAAEFETVPRIPLRDLLLNPRILVFQRTPASGSEAATSGSDTSTWTNRALRPRPGRLDD